MNEVNKRRILHFHVQNLKKHKKAPQCDTVVTTIILCLLKRQGEMMPNY